MRLGGMGVLKLDYDHAAIAAMSAAAAAAGRMRGWVRRMRGWACEWNLRAPMAGYEWAHQMFDDILTPVEPGQPEPDGVRGLITRGWMAVVRLHMRVAELAPADLSLVQ